MKLVHALNALIVLALIGLSAYVYPDLPDRIPLHFGADGTPDRWGPRSLLSWMLLPLVGAATGALMYGVALFIPGRPQSFNIPDKKKLLEMPPRLQEWVMRGVVDMLHIMALTMLVMFAAMQYGAWETVHTGTGSRWMVAGTVFALVVTPFVTIGFFLVIQRRMDRAWREYRTKGDAAAAPG